MCPRKKKKCNFVSYEISSDFNEMFYMRRDNKSCYRVYVGCVFGKVLFLSKNVL